MAHTLTTALGLALLAGAEARAQSVTLALDVDPQKSQQLGLDTAAVQGDLASLIESELRLDTVTEFLDSMANAAAISSRGMGIDYASNPQKFVVGASVGTGVHDAGFTFAKGEQTLPTGGFAAQVSLMAGLNLGGVLGAKKGAAGRRFLVYANGMSMPLPSSSPFGGSMYNVGAHLQVNAIGGGNGKIAEWGGLSLNGGFERSTYVMRLRRDLPLEVPSGGVDLGWAATGEFEVTALSDAIPLEISTNVRVLAVTAFLGGGVDLVTGTSVVAASMSGPIEGSAGGRKVDLGNATLSVAADGIADELVPRLFVGAQANVLMVKAYGQLNVGLNDALGGHLGLRVAR